MLNKKVWFKNEFCSKELNFKSDNKEIYNEKLAVFFYMVIIYNIVETELSCFVMKKVNTDCLWLN